MDSRDREEKMDVAPLPLVTKESIRPFVQQFVDQLSLAQWINLESGSVDKKLEDIIVNMCVELVNVISKYMCEAFKLSLQQDLSSRKSPAKSTSSSSGSDGSQKSFNITDRQVCECLGDAISHTLSESLGVQDDTFFSRAERVTKLVSQEVAENVNSELSRSSGSSSDGNNPQVTKTSDNRLRRIVRHVIEMLKRCACIFISRKKTQTLTDEDKDVAETVESLPSPVSALREEVEEPRGTLTPQREQLQKSRQTPVTPPKEEIQEKCQTPIAPLTEDGAEKSSTGSFVDETTKAVKEILEEQVNDIVPIDVDGISEDEIEVIVVNASQDTSEAASAIAEDLLNELTLEKDDKAKSRQISCTEKVVRKIKALFVQRFAKLSVLSLVKKLRRMFEDCCPPADKEAALEKLMSEVSCLVDDMLPSKADEDKTSDKDMECLYQVTAMKIYKSQGKNISNQLAKVIVKFFKPSQQRRLHFLGVIETEVETLMKLMWNWLDQQAQNHKTKTDHASVALTMIEDVVVNLPALTESPLEKQCDSVKSSLSRSSVDETTKAVKEILEEQVNNIVPIDVDSISEEEIEVIVSIASQDMSEAAIAIAENLLNELTLETDDTAKSRQISCCEKVVSKIKALFVQRFAKLSVLSLVKKLRRMFKDCSPPADKQASLENLMSEVGCLVDDILPSKEDEDQTSGEDMECLYQVTASKIYKSQGKNISRKLVKLIVKFFKPSEQRRLHFLGVIETEVGTFMKLLWNWLNQQAQKHKTKRDPASVALKMIEDVVASLPALTESPLVKDRDSGTPVSEGASEKSSFSSTGSETTQVVKEIQKSRQTPVTPPGHEIQEKCQTPIAPLTEDGAEKSSTGSFVDETAKAVKEILDEQVNDIVPIDFDGVSEEEIEVIVVNASQDTSEAASAIAEDLLNELTLETDDKAKSGQISCWEKVVRKIKALFVHRFAKLSVLSLVKKLRRMLKCCYPPADKEAALDNLIKEVDCLVDDMLPSKEDEDKTSGKDMECLYHVTARKMYTKQGKNIDKRLAKLIEQFLKPIQKHRLYFIGVIQDEVDKFMQVMWNWLKQQAQKHKTKRDPASVALRMIEDVVVSLPALTESPLVKVRDSETPVSEGASDKSFSSTADETTQAVKEILEEQVNNLGTIHVDSVSEEEGEMIVSSASQDMSEAATSITEELLKELTLETDDTAKSQQISCSKNVVRKIKALFVTRFAKLSVISLVTRLRNMFDDCCPPVDKEASLENLISEVSSLVDDMLPSKEDEDKTSDKDMECLYEVTAMKISKRQGNNINKRLTNLIEQFLKPSQQHKLHFLGVIQVEVDKFMKLLWNWLNQQAQKYKTKKDPASVALKMIEDVMVSLPALTESPLVKDRDSGTPVSEGASEKSSFSSTVGETTQAVKEIQKSKTPVTPPGERIQKSTQTPVTPPGEKIQKFRRNPVTRPRKKVQKSRHVPVTCVSEIPVSEAAPASITDEPTSRDKAPCESTADPLQKWDEVDCINLVSAFINQTVKNTSIDVTDDRIVSIHDTLKEMLWEDITSCHFLTLPHGHDIKKIARAAHKDLVEIVGSAGSLGVSLQLHNDQVKRLIINAIEAHLMIPQRKTCFTRFKSVLKTMAKPFTAFFR